MGSHDEGEEHHSLSSSLPLFLSHLSSSLRFISQARALSVLKSDLCCWQNYNLHVREEPCILYYFDTVIKFLARMNFVKSSCFMFFESCLQASLGIIQSPRAFTGRERSEFFKVLELLMGGNARNFSKSQRLYYRGPKSV